MRAVTPHWCTIPLIAALWCQAASAPAAIVENFTVADVRLQAGPFLHAQELDLAYILALDPQRLLAPFRREAGLPEVAKPYGNWESGGLDGHMGGHYLSALALMSQATGDAECARRLTAMVQELADCQQANGDGYVGGIPGSKRFWAEFATDRDPGRKIASKWVPWYNLHKTFAGLRDAWVLAGNAQAREVLLGLCDWAVRITRNLKSDQWEAMLNTEYGGMNDVLAEVAMRAGRTEYRDLAARFSHRRLLDSLAKGEDRLTGKHANTQIPKVIGYERMALATGEPRYDAAARFFWETVVLHRSSVIGGSSVSEHFHALDDFTRMIEHREGPESCNTYNLIKLSELLYTRDGDARYPEYCERALFNHILSTQHPVSGGMVYFTPLRPQHYRVYSQVRECMWCCVGTGLENHAKHGELIYAHRGADELFLNQFIASTLTWGQTGVVVHQETAFPDEERTRLRLACRAPTAFALHLRHPAWVPAGDLAITVNGQAQVVTTQPGSYATITRTWQDGDVVEVALPMHTTVEPLPAKPDYVAVLHGPIVLAAATGTDQLAGLVADGSRSGHIANGPLIPLADTPALVGTPQAIAAAVVPVSGKPLTFTATAAIQPMNAQGTALVPFFRVHDARYIVYWRHAADAAALATADPQAHAAEAEALALDRITLDRVVPGEQQPETDHHLQGEGTRTGSFRDRPWRDASGWFSYDLTAAPGRPVALAVTLWGGDRRSYDVAVNGAQLARVESVGNEQRFSTRTWTLPAALVAASQGRYTVTFTAPPKGVAGGVFDVRLVAVP